MHILHIPYYEIFILIILHIRWFWIYLIYCIFVYAFYPVRKDESSYHRNLLPIFNIRNRNMMSEWIAILKIYIEQVWLILNGIKHNHISYSLRKDHAHLGVV